MNVLVVDDDPTLRMLMREVICSILGYKALAAGNGLEAWNMLNSGEAFDLCVFDIRMPNLGGMELLRRMRSDKRLRRQSVILCSTINERSTIIEAAALGVSSYILKPFLMDDFLDRVKRVCERPFKYALQTREPFEPLELVLKRLGIGLPLYQELVGVFTKDVAELINMVRGASSSVSQEEMEMKLGAIAPAARTIGAMAMVEMFMLLERTMARDGVTALTPFAPILEAENAKAMEAAHQMEVKHAASLPS